MITVSDIPVDKFIDLILLNATGQIGCPPTEHMVYDICWRKDKYTCKACWLKYLIDDIAEST